MNKKGIIQEKIYWIVIEFILVGIFITGSLLYISNMSGSLLYERIYLTKTLAIKMSTLQAAPGEISYYYANPELENFNVLLEQNRINLRETKGTAFTSHLFPRNADIEIKTKNFNAVRKIGFEKQDNFLTLTSDAGYLVKDRCPHVESTAKGLMLDPGHGGFDEGIKQNDFIEAETNRQIAFQILRNSPYKLVDSTRSVSTEEHKTPEQRIGKLNQKKDYALVGIQTNNEGDNIKAYINLNSDVMQSRKIACEINNALIDVMPDLNALIIPINPEQLDKNNPLKVLEAVAIGVVIEINYPTIRADIVGESIKKGIAKYKGTAE